jgi:hypothetical protein
VWGSVQKEEEGSKWLNGLRVMDTSIQIRINRAYMDFRLFYSLLHSAFFIWHKNWATKKNVFNLLRPNTHPIVCTIRWHIGWSISDIYFVAQTFAPYVDTTFWLIKFTLLLHFSLLLLSILLLLVFFFTSNGRCFRAL